MNYFIARNLPAVCFGLCSLFLAGCAGTTPLGRAAAAGNAAEVQKLLSQGADVNYVNPNFNPQLTPKPLILASCPCRPDIIRILLKAGADVNAQWQIDPNDESPRNALEQSLDCGIRRATGDCDEAARLLRAAGAHTSSSIAANTPATAPINGAPSGIAQPQVVSPPMPTASAVDSPSYSMPPDPNKFALVIGIAKYRDIPEAEYADNDAKAVKRHLLALGYPEENIVTLLGDRATKSTLEDKLERWLPMNVDSKSTVFVYYSGHGAPDAATKDAYLLPWDGDPASLQATALPLSRFYKDLNHLPAKRVLVALDSCFSGAGGRSVLPKGGRPLITQVVTGFPNDGKVVAFTASSSDQISGTLEDQGHGAFTYYFLRGLNGDAAAGHGVTVGSLYDYLSHNVSASAHRQEREQNPQLLSAQGDDRSIQIR